MHWLFFPRLNPSCSYVLALDGVARRLRLSLRDCRVVLLASLEDADRAGLTELARLGWCGDLAVVDPAARRKNTLADCLALLRDRPPAGDDRVALVACRAAGVFGEAALVVAAALACAYPKRCVEVAMPNPGLGGDGTPLTYTRHDRVLGPGAL